MKSLKPLLLSALLLTAVLAKEKIMLSSDSVIRGEHFQSDLKQVNSEALEALNQFYKAFNHKDIKLMQKNWMNDSSIAMDNPLGGIKRGWKEIQTVYERIFSGPTEVYVEFYDFTIIDLDGGFCAVGRERGSATVGSKVIDLEIRTSRVFKRNNGKYQQVHHHGSIESADLLHAYQTLVK